MISTVRILGTSLARRSVRRWIVALYWCGIAAISLAFLLHTVRHHGLFLGSNLVIILYFLPALLGGVRTGGAVKPFRGIVWAPLIGGDVQRLFGKAERTVSSADAELDERERRLRDGVHFVAYTLVRWFALLLFVAYGAIGLLHAEWLSLVGPTFFFLLILVLWSLPQSLILWNEPDLEEAQ